MRKLIRKPKRLVVEFCDRCAAVCDADCRAAAIRERSLLQALQLGGRV